MLIEATPSIAALAAAVVVGPPPVRVTVGAAV